jgi:hypothetical protein
LVGCYLTGTTLVESRECVRFALLYVFLLKEKIIKKCYRQKEFFLKKYRMAAEQWTVEKRDTDTYHKLLKNETMTFMKKT